MQLGLGYSGKGSRGRVGGRESGVELGEGLRDMDLRTEEGEDGGDDADEEGETLAFVAALVEEGGKDVFGGAMRGEVGHGD